MAGKIWIALFAFLAVQGWTSARILPEELLNLEPEGVDESFVKIPIEHFDEPKQAHIGTHDVVPYGNPLNCLKYLSDAYDTAKEVRDLALQTVDYVKTLGVELKKCINLDGFEDIVKCLYNTGETEYPTGKNLYDNIKSVIDKSKDIMEKFDNCMD